MATLANEMLDHSCDRDDDKMETIYQTDYVKRGSSFMLFRCCLIRFICRNKFNQIHQADAGRRISCWFASEK